jgi:hypothetical protein
MEVAMKKRLPAVVLLLLVLALAVAALPLSTGGCGNKSEGTHRTLDRAVTAEPYATTGISTTTTKPLPVYNLRVDMTYLDPSPVPREYTASWGENFSVNLDGTVQTRLPGELTVTIPWKVGDKDAAEYRLIIDFNVDMTGSWALTTAGMRLKVQQTLADYWVQPLAVVDGQISPAELASIQESTEENAPSLLKRMLVGLSFEGASLPATEDISAGMWKGRATLTQVQSQAAVPTGRHEKT